MSTAAVAPSPAVVPSRRRQFGRCGIGMKFRERAVEVEQQNKRGFDRAPCHLGLNFRQHPFLLCGEYDSARE